MKKSLQPVIALFLLSISLTASASYRDGAAGVFLVMFSVPVAMGGLVLTIILTAKDRFRKPGLILPYCLIWLAVWILVVIFVDTPSLQLDDPESITIVAVGEGILVAFILLPALVQSWRSQKSRGPLQSERPKDSSSA
jgi:hypothetical protein